MDSFKDWEGFEKSVSVTEVRRQEDLKVGCSWNNPVTCVCVCSPVRSWTSSWKAKGPAHQASSPWPPVSVNPSWGLTNTPLCCRSWRDMWRYLTICWKLWHDVYLALIATLVSPSQLEDLASSRTRICDLMYSLSSTGSPSWLCWHYQGNCCI